MPRSLNRVSNDIHRPICGSLAYIWDRDADAVLLVHRNARPDDDHLGKYNGLGGKLERGESIVENLRRELAEEANIEVRSFRLRGTLAWPGFGANGEDWLGFVFLVDEWDGAVPPANPEGDLLWISRSRLLDACSDDLSVREAAGIPMWDGDRRFIPMVFDDGPPFHGVNPYHEGKPVGFTFERVSW